VTKTPHDFSPLPDSEICRTRYTGLAFMALCLVDQPQRCTYAQQFGGAFYCHHSDRLKFDEELKKNSG